MTTENGNPPVNKVIPEKRKFWVTCPDCKRKFGVNPGVVLKYMNRLIIEASQGVTKSYQDHLKRQQSRPEKERGS